MTFNDLIDQVAFDANDDAAEYTAAARRWLNLMRSDVAATTLWKTALNPVATITTAATTTSGIYSLTGYDFICGDYIFDETTRMAIEHNGLAQINIVDPAKNVFGPPQMWADAGMDTNGVRQIYLWPIPNDTRTIRFPGYRALVDIGESQLALDLDPYFGPLTPWAGAFSAGMRYYHDLNNNESAAQIQIQQAGFHRKINQRKSHNRLSLSSKVHMADVRAPLSVYGLGRFDPSVYPNW